MKGWIKLHRSIMESGTFRKLNAIQQLITIYIILNANHEDGVWYDKYKDVEVPIKRGQLITSRNKIANDWFSGEKDITERKVRTTLNRLEKYGFLTKQTTNGYTLLTICNYSIYQAKDNESDQANDQAVTRHRPGSDQALTTNKNDKNEKNDKEVSTSTDAIVFYQNNFGLIKPYISEEMLYWIDDLGDEMVTEALGRALDRGKPSWGYAKSILQSWSGKGIKTLDQAKAEEVEFQNQQSSKRGNYQPQQQEIVPDWFKNRKQKQRNSDSNNQNDWEETARLLSKYKASDGN
ncbi:DnaD domain-containing protein [Virgibacillus doumboii]|uniref:DnaD domain-containing protein n=1 Tax=Virgibacillus doumboii TaxID=2697503 RepID=UPI0013DE86F0|nr:DnaD domain protein [Virgibacillus doumboii]